MSYLQCKEGLRGSVLLGEEGHVRVTRILFNFKNLRDYLKLYTIKLKNYVNRKRNRFKTQNGIIRVTNRVTHRGSTYLPTFYSTYPF